MWREHHMFLGQHLTEDAEVAREVRSIGIVINDMRQATRRRTAKRHGGGTQREPPCPGHANAAHHVSRPRRAAGRRGAAVCLSTRRRLARCRVAFSLPAPRSTAQAPSAPEKVSSPRPPPRHSRRSAAGAGARRGRAAAERRRGRGGGGARSSRPERRPVQGPGSGLRAAGVRRSAAARLGGAAPGAWRGPCCWFRRRARGEHSVEAHPESLAVCAEHAHTHAR